jgi:superfamily II DNA or RNA helicase
VLQFYLDHNCSRLTSSDSTELNYVRELLTFEDPRKLTSRDYLHGLTEGRICLLDDEGVFPSGVLPKILSRLQVVGIEFKVEQELSYPDPQLPLGHPNFNTRMIPGSRELRDYQLASIERALHWKRGVINIATGGGKTLVMIGIVKALGGRALVQVETVATLQQTCSEFAASGFSSLGSCSHEGSDLSKQVVVGTVKTLTRLFLDRKTDPELLQDFTSYHVDETHHLPAKTWYRLGLMVTAPYRFGYSATPYDSLDQNSLDDNYLEGILGQQIVRLPYSYLVQRGYLAQAYVVQVDYRSQSHLPYHLNDWIAISKSLIQDQVRNTQIVNIAASLYQRGLKVLISVREIEHGKELLRRLGNVEAQFSWGGSTLTRVGQDGELKTENVSYEDVKQYYDGVERGILIGSTVYDESQDLPSFNAIILASGGRGGDLGRKVIQRTGRALRPKPGENYAYVIDFNDNSNCVLLKHTKERKRVYLEHGYVVLSHEQSQQLLKEWNGSVSL